MRILIVSQYFWPESFIINDLVKSLAAQGHYVKVLTGKPNYPDGAIFDGYSSLECQEESYSLSIPVFRAPLRPRGQSGAKNLILNYLSFIVSGLRFYPGAVKDQSFDTILVFAPSPITSVIPSIYLKWKLKVHLAVWVQDLWPESLSATGFIKNHLLLRAVGVVVKAIYACTDTLLVQSKAFIKPISRYAALDKVVYYPNGCWDSYVSSIDTIPKYLLDILDNNFCLVFAGNLGTAQSVETLILAAEELLDVTEIKIILVGSGSMTSWIERQKIARKLDNLILAGRFPVTEMASFFSRASGLLVTLKRDEIFSFTIPSKIQAYLSAGRPIIAAIDGEGARLVEEAAAGFTGPAEDALELSRLILRLYNMPPADREKMGHAGRQYYLEHFEMTQHSRRLITILEDRIRSKDKGAE